MGDLVVTQMDPWLAESRKWRGTAEGIPVGRWELYVGIDTLTEEAFLVAGEGRWELWCVLGGSAVVLDRFLMDPMDPFGHGVGGVLRRGLAVAGVMEGRPDAAARSLFEALVRARGTFAGICGPYVGGLLSADTLAGIVAGFTDELERNHRAAIQAEVEEPSPILVMARSLGMIPRPAGHSATAWEANCPSGGQHSIMISTTSHTFGCGYCRRKGGADELRSWWLERRRKRGLDG